MYASSYRFNSKTILFYIEQRIIKLYSKVVGVSDSSLRAIYVHFRNREGGKMAAF